MQSIVCAYVVDYGEVEVNIRKCQTLHSSTKLFDVFLAWRHPEEKGSDRQRSLSHDYLSSGEGMNNDFDLCRFALQQMRISLEFEACCQKVL